MKEKVIGTFTSQLYYKILARFSMQDSKKGFSPFRHGVHLSKQMCPKTQEERERENEKLSLCFGYRKFHVSNALY